MATLVKNAHVIFRRSLFITSSKQRITRDARRGRKDTDLREVLNDYDVTERDVQTVDGNEQSPQHKANWKSAKKNLKMLTNDHSYEVLDADDHRLGRTILQAKSKRGRSDLNEILIEGEHSIVDALKANGVIKALYFSSTELLQNFPLHLLSTDVPLFKVPKFKLNLFTDLATSPGILGRFEMPPEGEALKPPDKILPITLVCNDVRDPALLGSLLQSAAAVGCHRVILMKGCCDHWNSKVVRSSGLSQFYLSILSDITWAQINSVLMLDRPLQVFLLRKERITPKIQQHYDGSERTFSRLQEIEEHEMNEHRENRHYEEDNIENNSQEFGANHERKQEIPKEEPKWSEDYLYNSFNHLKEYKKAPLTLQRYDQVDYTVGHSVIIIDDNYSLQSKKFVYDNEGMILHFPIASKLYGLTSSMAGSLAMFEAGKQFRDRMDKLGTEN